MVTAYLLGFFSPLLLLVLAFVWAVVFHKPKKKREAGIALNLRQRDMGYRYPDGRVEVTIDPRDGGEKSVIRIATVADVPERYRALVAKDIETWWRDEGRLLGLSEEQLDRCLPRGDDPVAIRIAYASVFASTISTDAKNHN